MKAPETWALSFYTRDKGKWIAIYRRFIDRKAWGLFEYVSIRHRVNGPTHNGNHLRSWNKRPYLKFLTTQSSPLYGYIKRKILSSGSYTVQPRVINYAMESMILLEVLTFKRWASESPARMLVTNVKEGMSPCIVHRNFYKFRNRHVPITNADWNSKSVSIWALDALGLAKSMHSQHFTT